MCCNCVVGVVTLQCHLWLGHESKPDFDNVEHNDKMEVTVVQGGMKDDDDNDEDKNNDEDDG